VAAIWRGVFPSKQGRPLSPRPSRTSRIHLIGSISSFEFAEKKRNAKNMIPKVPLFEKIFL
jgi:hypothetical protein